MDLVSQLTRLAAETDFSGAAVAHGGSGRGGAERVVELVHGFADRANGRPNTLDTRFGTASATKGLTALAAASLIESGDLSFETTLRDLTSDDLPHVDPAVTVEDLLGHTSGVGDYLGEDAIRDIDDYLLSILAHRLSDPDA